jgi:hypothetical protein
MKVGLLALGGLAAVTALFLSTRKPTDEPGSNPNFPDPDPNFDSEDDSGVVRTPDSPPEPQ